MKMKTIMERAGLLDNTCGRWSEFFTGAAGGGNMDSSTKGVGSEVKSGARTLPKRDVGSHLPSSSGGVDGVPGIN